MSTKTKLEASIQAQITRDLAFLNLLRSDEPMQHLIAELEAETEGRASEDSYLDDEIDFSFSGDKKLLEWVWGKIRSAGFELQPGWGRPQKKSSSWMGRFCNPESNLKLWVSFSSTACRRVKVGTRMAEVSIYETRCDDEASEAFGDAQ